MMQVQEADARRAGGVSSKKPFQNEEGFEGMQTLADTQGRDSDSKNSQNSGRKYRT